MKKLLFILIPILFTSCVWIPQRDYISIRDKSSYETFTGLSNPIVLSKQLSADFTMQMNKNETASRLLGGVFTIYDFETDTVKDYVSVDTARCYYPILQKYITSTGDYKFGLWDKYEGKFYFVSPDKTEISYADSSELSRYYFDCDSMEDVYRYKLFYTNESEVYDPSSITTLRFFDADTNKFGKSFEIPNYYSNKINTPGYVPTEKGGDGYVWFFTQKYERYPDRGEWYLNRVNPVTEVLETNLATFASVEGDKTIKNLYTDKSDWNHEIVYTVVDAIGDNLLVKRYHDISDYSGTGYSANDFQDYIVVNKTTFAVTVLDARKTAYVGRAAGKYWFCSNDYVFTAYDAVTLDKITDTTEMSFTSDKDSIYVPEFYINNDIIYAFATKRDYPNKQEWTKQIYAFDCANRKLIKKTEISESRLYKDE